MLKIFSYLNNIHKKVCFSVFYIILQVLLPFKKLKILPSDLPIILVL